MTSLYTPIVAADRTGSADSKGIQFYYIPASTQNFAEAVFLLSSLTTHDLAR